MFRRKKVLLVMNDKDLLSKFIDILVHYTTAFIFQGHNAIEALYSMKRFQPDVVILQMSLPDVELNRFLKSVQNLSDTEDNRPCIVGASEDGSLSAAEKSYYTNLGVNLMIVYPVTRADLERLVRDACPHIDWRQEAAS